METLPQNPSETLIGAEFDKQLSASNPFELIRENFGDFNKGPLILALGAVGGGGAGEKARGILEQFTAEQVPFVVTAMEKYLASNPGIAGFLTSLRIPIELIDDNVGIPQLYRNSFEVIEKIAQNYGSLSGLLSLGPRTYYPEAARNLNLPSMIIDGAVPDKWEETIDPITGFPNTEYYLPAYSNALYATTCGFTGWFPPAEKFPTGMNLKMVAQPFSADKLEYLKSLRNLTPEKCLEILLDKNSIDSLDRGNLIIVPTFDQVYLDPKTLTVFGGFLTPEQLGQSYGFMAELIASLAKLNDESGKNILLYLKPGVIRNTVAPLLSMLGEKGIKLIGPIDSAVANEDWLLLRKAGVTIGRAPLCVSTAEAFGMADYQITTAVPGKTNDGISYMTEFEALSALDSRGITRTLFPGQSLLEAIKDVMKFKKL